jgi:RHS repeat-associated protein
MQVRDPGNFIVSAAYNTRGLPTIVTEHDPLGGAQGNQSTTYSWHSVFALPTLVARSGSQSSYFGYDGATGNRLWQRLGTHDSTKVMFAYYADGLLQSVTPPGMNAETFTYDQWRRNLASTTAANLATSHFYTDAIGRDTLSTSPINTTHQQRTKVTYDLMNRVISTSTFGPQMTLGSINAPADSVIVSNTYDDEGNVTSVSRTRGINYPGNLLSSFQYDAAHRMWMQTQSGRTESFGFDAAGNVTAHATPLGTINMKYDAASRLTRRIVPQKSYPAESCDTQFTWCYYSFPTTAASQVCLPADTAYFSYDATGRIIRADNVHAKIRRAYNPRGALTHDTLRIRSYYSAGSSPCEVDPAGVGPTSEWGAHVHALHYGYALDGKRINLGHPGGWMTYTYNSNTGWLGNVADAGYATVALNYDGQGRVRNIWYPWVEDARAYGTDGRLTYRSVHSTNYGTMIWDVYSYDLQDRVTSMYIGYKQGNMAGHTALSYYTALGAVGETNGHNVETSFSETMNVDALGNRMRRAQPGLRTTGHPDYQGIRFFTYDGEGRLGSVSDSTVSGYDLEERYSYEAGQNHRRIRYEWVAGQSVTLDQSRLYYGIDNKLRIVNNHVGINVGPMNQGTLYEEHRYDALGRRVQVRAMRPDACDVNVHGNLGCSSYVERTVWDGDQILLESRRPGGYGKSSSALDYGTGNTSEYGTVLSIHPLGVLGVDGAVAFRKNGIWIAAHKNWRGQYEIGTDINGVPSPQWSGLQLHWLGAATTVDGSRTSLVPLAQWWGSLLSNKEDASGLNYMRNRFYDPKLGIFTQIDPIGLRGGLNLYGFGHGDPVNFVDPFGLEVKLVGAAAQALWAELRSAARKASKSKDAETKAAGQALYGMLKAMERDKNTLYVIQVAPWIEELLHGSGGGLEYCRQDGTVCSISIASNPGWPAAGRATTLAHEAGGAYGSVRGVQHESDGGAVLWENYARAIFGCKRRDNESQSPTFCR